MTRRFLPLALAALLPLPAVAQDETMVWIYNRYVDPNPMNTSLTLVYGIPETDAVQVVIACAIGANSVYTRVDLGTDVEGLADEAAVPLQLSMPSGAAPRDGTVFRQEEGIWGVRLAVELNDPLWPELTTGGSLVYGVPGRQAMNVPLDGIAGPLRSFLGDCYHIDELAAQDAAAGTAGK